MVTRHLAVVGGGSLKKHRHLAVVTLHLAVVTRHLPVVTGHHEELHGPYSGEMAVFHEKQGLFAGGAPFLPVERAPRARFRAVLSGRNEEACAERTLHRRLA